MRLWGLASPKFAGQASELEAQAGADIAISRQNFFLLRKPCFCSYGFSTV